MTFRSNPKSSGEARYATWLCGGLMNSSHLFGYVLWQSSQRRGVALTGFSVGVRCI